MQPSGRVRACGRILGRSCPGPLRRSYVAALALLLAIGAAVGGVRAEEYRLQPGDVLEISVAGISQLSGRAPVQIDGSLSFPMIGSISAAGWTISEARDRIQAALASQLHVIYLPDGSEVMRAVEREQVSASVVEYRPVFVTGDVVQPGEIAFRPGMTARQLIAAAGGLASSAGLLPGYDPIQLRSDYAAAWHAAVAASARVWQLRTQLGETVEFARDAWPSAPGVAESLDEILRVEQDITEVRESDHVNERSFLARQVEQISGQIGVLRNQLAAEKEGEQADADMLATALEAARKGVYTQARLQDIRGAALISSTRRLQTTVDLMQLERRQTEASRELERLDERRRLDLLEQLQAARTVEGRERARLTGASEKLDAAGLALPSPADRADGFEVVIVRQNVAHPLDAGYETEVRPGDVVEVRRRSDAAAIGSNQGGSS